MVLPLSRSGHSAVVLKDGRHIVFFGGWNGENHLNDLSVLDMEAMAWLSLGGDYAVKNQGPSFRSGHSSILLQTAANRNQIMTFGGWNHKSFISDTWVMSLRGFGDSSSAEGATRSNVNGEGSKTANTAVASSSHSHHSSGVTDLLNARGAGVIDEMEEWNQIISKMVRQSD